MNTDTGVLRSLDFQLAIPCAIPDQESPAGGCAEVSDIWLRCLTCGSHVALCWMHYEILADWMIHEGGDRTIACVCCPGKVLLGDWWRLFETIERADGW